MPDKKISSCRAAASLRALEYAVRSVFDKKTPLDNALKSYFRANRNMGSKDRRQAGGIVYSYFRRYGWVRNVFGERSLSPAAVLAACAASGCVPDDFEAFCDLAHVGCDAFLDAVKLSTSIERFEAVSGGKVEYSDLVPDWSKKFMPSCADDKFFEFLSTRPPVWIRLQTSDVQKVADELSAMGITVKKHPFSEKAFCLGDAVSVTNTDSYRHGLFEVQDLSSQFIGLAAASGGISGVWRDLCCGAGGKTLLLCAAMDENTSKIEASDLRGHTLDELLSRARRCGKEKMIKTFVYDALTSCPQKYCEKYDGVLADCPCSSSGRWRRDPAARWVTTEEDVLRLSKLQAGILFEGAKMVKAGGLLVYGTCSMFEVENFCVIKDFLASHKDFELEKFVSPSDGKTCDGTLFTLPQTHDSDASFVARLRRRKA